MDDGRDAIAGFDPRAVYGFEPMDDGHELCLASITGFLAGQYADRLKRRAGGRNKRAERWDRLARICKARADELAGRLGITAEPHEE